jgi:DNA replication protein DnaC
MSTDTLYQQLRGHLHYLKLPAIAEQLAPALERAERDRPGYSEFLTRLLETEVDATEQRRLTGRLRFSKLPARKTLAQFDRDAQPALDPRMIDELATLRFIEEKANVLLIGPPGVGKTHLAVALGHQAVEAGYRVFYTTAADLVARTNRAALEGRWQNTMRFWNGPQLLLIDLCRHRDYAEGVTCQLSEVPANRCVPSAREGPDIGIVTGSRGRPGGRPGACSGRA